MGLNNATMDIAATYLCHGDNLQFMCFKSPCFQRFIHLLRSRTVGPDWRPPCCNRIASELLDTNYQIIIDINVNSCMSEAKIFGMVMPGDFATIKECHY